jgi:hypothetical protein
VCAGGAPGAVLGTRMGGFVGERGDVR